MLGLDYINGDEIIPIDSIKEALFIGAFVSFFLVLLQYRRLKQIGITEITSQNLRVEQSKTIESKITIEELISSISSSGSFKLVKLNDEEDVINFQSKMTGFAAGCAITIHINKLNNGIIEYNINSKPLLKTVLFDCGANITNINIISEFLEQ